MNTLYPDPCRFCGCRFRSVEGIEKHSLTHSTQVEDITQQLNIWLESCPSSTDSVALLRDCITLFIAHDGNYIAEEIPAFLERLLESVIKPLFSKTIKPSPYQMRFSDEPVKPWRDSAAWCLDVLQWILMQYSILGKPLQKRTIESHVPLLVPPILTLLDDDDATQKTLGSRLLSMLCSRVFDCRSEILARTGLIKVFEDSLVPNMLLLPSLTPEKQSFEALGSLYPAYRAMVKATFDTDFPETSRSQRTSTIPAQRNHQSSNGALVLAQPDNRQAMLDRVLRNGLLAGYSYASDYVHIASMLVSEMSLVIELMGALSAKYLPRLLPLFRNILTNPLGFAHPPLLKAAVIALRQLILQCWPRIREVWWEECARTVIGLWLLLSEENEETSKILKRDAKSLISLLVQLRGPAESQKSLYMLQAECDQLAELLKQG